MAAFAFYSNPHLHELPWTGVGLARLAVYCAVFLALGVLGWAWPFRAPRGAAWFASAGLLYGVGVVGLKPFAAVALYCVSSIAVGSMVVSEAPLILCFCLGEGLLGFTASLLGWTYFCYPATFLALLVLPIVLRRRWLAARAVAVPMPGGLAAILVAFAIGIQFLLALKPEVGADSLAMHLALPAFVANHHHWAFDVREFLWAVMPQTTDWCYTIAYSIGGEYAARLLNFANLLAILGLLYTFARWECSQTAALGICALFATGPLVQVVTGSLFIDNLLAALLFAAVSAFCIYFRRGGERFFVAGWLLLGLSLSAKTAALAFVPGLLALAVCSALRHPVRRRVWAISLAGGLGIGAYFYVLAQVRTGNPFFPYANEIFRSKLMDTVPVSPQFRSHLHWRTWYDITFHSADYLEGTDGSAGFQYFLLLPAALVILVRRKGAAAMWWPVGIALVAFALSFSQLSYLRYVYPELLMLMLPMALWLDQQRRIAAAAMAAAGVLNILFQASSGWYHRDFVWEQIWNKEGRAEYLERSAPARRIVEELNRIAPGEPALFCQRDPVAEFQGAAYTTNWHTLHRGGELRNMREATGVLQFVKAHSIRYFASPFPEDLDTWPRVLPGFFSSFTEPVFSSGRWRLFRLRPSPYVFPPAGTGTYDDQDVRLVLHGNWYREFGYFDPLYHTLTTSKHPGDELSFHFAGSGIAIEFSRDAGFGIGEVLIDRQVVAEIDEYAASPQHRLRRVIEGLDANDHTLSLRVSGRKNPMARDSVVVLDALTVFE